MTLWLIIVYKTSSDIEGIDTVKMLKKFTLHGTNRNILCLDQLESARNTGCILLRIRRYAAADYSSR